MPVSVLTGHQAAGKHARESATANCTVEFSLRFLRASLQSSDLAGYYGQQGGLCPASCPATCLSSSVCPPVRPAGALLPPDNGHGHGGDVYRRTLTSLFSFVEDFLPPLCPCPCPSAGG